MQVIEFNNKTVANLLKKSVTKYWMKGKDTWLKFDDGSVVCIHLLNPSWSSYVLLKELDDKTNPSFNDEQSVWFFDHNKEDDQPYTSRIVSIHFRKIRYYYHDDFKDYTKREYLPVIEFHYYEKGEEWE